MSKQTRVLMVDDEPNVLSAYRRGLGRTYDLVTAQGGRAGLDVMAESPPFAVVITDMRMPEVDGLAFLKIAQRRHKSSVYMMLTGNADQQTAIDAINEGKIFRFLNKPCKPGDLEAAILAAKRQHDLQQAERTLLQETLSGSVKLLVEAMTISDLQMINMINRLRTDTQALAGALEWKTDWQMSIAASLSMLGSITVPETVGKETLADTYLQACADSGAKMLRHIPRLEVVSTIIAEQHQGGNMPTELNSSTDAERVAVESRILGFAVAWYRQTQRCNGDRAGALRELVDDQCTHDPRLILAAEKIVAAEIDRVATQAPPTPTMVEPGRLAGGMTLDQDVLTVDGNLLVAKGQLLTATMAERLRGFARSGVVETKTLRVLIHPPQGDQAKTAA